MNTILAWVCGIGLLVYFAVEFGWGGGTTDGYQDQKRKRERHREQDHHP